MAKASGDPSSIDTITEPFRAAGEFGLSINCIVKASLKYVCPNGNGTPVMTIPGFMAHGATMLPMRQLLRQLGYEAYDWKQGFNLGPQRRNIEKLAERLIQISDKHDGAPVDVVGHSLGGVYAEALVSFLRDTGRIGRIQTLGSPINPNVIIQDPEHDGVQNGVRALFDGLNSRQHADVMHFQSLIEDIIANGLDVPMSCVYSRTDGVVGPVAAISTLPGENIENIQVPGSHIGLGVNPLVSLIVADRLAQPQGELEPFDFAKYSRLIKELLPTEQLHEIMKFEKDELMPMAA